MKVKLTSDQANEAYWALSARLEMWQDRRDATGGSIWARDAAQERIEDCAAAMWAIDNARKGRR